MIIDELVDLLNEEGFDVDICDKERIRKIISKKLIDEVSELDDVQYAFDILDSKYKNLLSRLFLYDIGDWFIGFGQNYEQENFQEYKNSFNELFDKNVKSSTELLHYLEHEVRNVMCDAGTDCSSGLNGILEDLAISDDIFIVEGLKENPEVIWA